MKMRVLVRAAGVGPSLSLLRMLGVVLLWLAAGCVDAAFAQGARVDGVVRDSSGAAVQGANVELHAGAVDRERNALPQLQIRDDVDAVYPGHDA